MSPLVERWLIRAAWLLLGLVAGYLAVEQVGLVRAARAAETVRCDGPDGRYAGRQLRAGQRGLGGCCIARTHTGRIKRSSSERRRFLVAHHLRGTPTLCQIDHVIALKCGGCDTLENLQLLCEPELSAKEATEGNCESYYRPIAASSTSTSTSTSSSLPDIAMEM